MDSDRAVSNGNTFSRQSIAVVSNVGSLAVGKLQLSASPESLQRSGHAKSCSLPTAREPQVCDHCSRLWSALYLGAYIVFLMQRPLVYAPFTASQKNTDVGRPWVQLSLCSSIHSSRARCSLDTAGEWWPYGTGSPGKWSITFWATR